MAEKKDLLGDFPFLKTGTTIVGCVFKDGVVLGADKRATVGSTVLEKACTKVHSISNFISACGAGVAGDTDKITKKIEGELKIFKQESGIEPRVVSAVTKARRHLFPYMGQLTAALIFGGVDETGPSLHMVAPSGYTHSFPFITMGSGCIAALGIFERFYKREMNREQASELVHRAISAGARHDQGSGFNIDVLIIDKNGKELIPSSGPVFKQRGEMKEYVKSDEIKIEQDKIVLIKEEVIYDQEKELTKKNAVHEIIKLFDE